MNRVSEEYGTDAPSATIPVTVGEQDLTFNIWISKSGRRIMAQNASTAALATAGFVRGLSGGLIRGDQDYQPFEDAARAYLSANKGPSCVLSHSQKLTRVGWEWDFDCAVKVAQAGPSEKGRQATLDNSCKKLGGAKIGMTKDQILKSCWGKPDKVNETVTAQGKHEQWIYGAGYLYLDDGILSSIQTSR